VLSESKRYGNEAAAYVYAVLNANERFMKGASEMAWIETMMKDPEVEAEMAKRGIGFINKAARDAERKSARVMLQNGEPYEKIAKYLFIPMEEIAEIDKELNAIL
jgi:hypothetical protein